MAKTPYARTALLVALGVSAGLTVMGCQASKTKKRARLATASGSTAAGSTTVTGGTATGGTATGGTTPTGSSATGGGATGGGATGGAATGGAATGGAATGGGATGGAATGGGLPISGGLTGTPTAGGSSAGGSSTPGSSGGAAPTPGTLTVTSQPLVATAAMSGQDVVVLALRFEAAGGPVVLNGFNVEASGRIDEPTDLGELRVVGDDNANGVVDAGEQALLTVASPAFPTDNGTVTLTITPPLTIGAGASVQLLVEVEVTLAGTPATRLPGRSIKVEVTDPSDVDSNAASTSGSFPLEGEVRVQAVDHLLITEINTRTPQFIEIYNPTAQTIDLSDVYITDYTHSGDAYWNLPTGTDFRPGFFSGDFLMRFPQGATLRPGNYATVTLNQDRFVQRYGQRSTFAMQKGQGGERMLGASSSNPPSWSERGPSAFAAIRNAGEAIVLFTWDGTSDRVQDLDYVFYGSPSGSGNAIIDKTGQAIDGPDSDSTPTSFLPETTSQKIAPDPGSGESLQRVDYNETGETKLGGNGATGHDETSEPWDTNFIIGRPTPLAP